MPEANCERVATAVGETAQSLYAVARGPASEYPGKPKVVYDQWPVSKGQGAKGSIKDGASG